MVICVINCLMREVLSVACSFSLVYAAQVPVMCVYIYFYLTRENTDTRVAGAIILEVHATRREATQNRDMMRQETKKATNEQTKQNHSEDQELGNVHMQLGNTCEANLEPHNSQNWNTLKKKNSSSVLPRHSLLYTHTKGRSLITNEYMSCLLCCVVCVVMWIERRGKFEVR